MIGRAFRWWFGVTLWKRILVALVLGAIAGWLWGEGAAEIKWIGDLFVRLIKMMVVPLIFVTLVGGICALTEPSRLASIGVRIFVLFLFTTLAGIAVGLGLGLLLEPGRGVVLEGVTPNALQPHKPIGERLMEIVPLNPVTAMAEGNALAVMFFALILGAGILMAGERGKPAAAAFESLSQALLSATRIVMEFAPFGVFALIAWVIGANGLQAFSSVFVLAVAVYAGCLIQVVVVHGGLVRFGANLPVLPFFRDTVDAQMVAYSTSSSAATLPVAMRVAETNLGVRPAVAASVLPLGATVNMDGTALYVALVALFSAQIFGVPLDAADYLMIVITTTLVSWGAASVPSASLFLLAIVLEAIGVTPEQTAIIVGFILPFDRILDMARTVPNVTGDLAMAVTIAKWEKELDLDTYLKAPTE